jgi:hypothetical protein
MECVVLTCRSDTARRDFEKEKAVTRTGAVCDCLRDHYVGRIVDDHPELAAVLAKGIPRFMHEFALKRCWRLKYAAVKRRRRVSGARRRRLTQIGFKKPSPAVLTVSQSEFATTVGREKTI